VEHPILHGSQFIPIALRQLKSRSENNANRRVKHPLSTKAIFFFTNFDKKEFWFSWSYPSDDIFAAGRHEVIPRRKATIGAQKVMVTVFFSGVTLVSLNTLPSGARFIQESFVRSILPDIIHETGRIFSRVRRAFFRTHGQFHVSLWSQGDR
jgi:hypothetical protein